MLASFFYLPPLGLYVCGLEEYAHGAQMREGGRGHTGGGKLFTEVRAELSGSYRKTS